MWHLAVLHRDTLLSLTDLPGKTRLSISNAPATMERYCIPRLLTVICHLRWRQDSRLYFIYYTASYVRFIIELACQSVDENKVTYALVFLPCCIIHSYVTLYYVQTLQSAYTNGSES